MHRAATVPRADAWQGRAALESPAIVAAPGRHRPILDAPSLRCCRARIRAARGHAAGRRRRFRAWIFTPSVSRYRFVWPCFHETTDEAIAACEAAWEFYGGVFRVLVPDNTKAIVTKADPLEPLLSQTFL